MAEDGMAMSSAHNPLNSTLNSSVRIDVPPISGDPDSALDPFLGTNLPMYPALPQSRRLSSFDPEWEDDPAYVAQMADEANRATQQRVLPSADVLKDVLRELHFARGQVPRQTQRNVTEAVGPEPSAASTTVSGQIRRGINTSKIDVNAPAVSLSSGEAVDSVLRDFQGRPFENAHTHRVARQPDLGAVPEPDLLRVNAGTGSHLQMGSTWKAADPGVGLVREFRAKADDGSLYAAPLLSTQLGYSAESYVDAASQRRVLNLVGGADELQLPTRRERSSAASAGAGEGGDAVPQENRERVKTFRSRRNMYEPRPRQFVEVDNSLEGGPGDSGGGGGGGGDGGRRSQEGRPARRGSALRREPERPLQIDATSQLGGGRYNHDDGGGGGGGGSSSRRNAGGVNFEASEGSAVISQSQAAEEATRQAAVEALAQAQTDAAILAQGGALPPEEGGAAGDESSADDGGRAQDSAAAAGGARPSFRERFADTVAPEALAAADAVIDQRRQYPHDMRRNQSIGATVAGVVAAREAGIPEPAVNDPHGFIAPAQHRGSYETDPDLGPTPSPIPSHGSILGSDDGDGTLRHSAGGGVPPADFDGTVRRVGSPRHPYRSAPRHETFDVQRWSDGRKNSVAAPSLRHFYKDVVIRAVN